MTAGGFTAARALIGVNLQRATGDRRFVLVATALPLVLIFVTGLAAGGTRVPVGLLDRGGGPAAARFVTLLEGAKGLTVRVEPTRTQLDDDVLRGRVVAGVVVPAAFGRGPDGRLDLAYVAAAGQGQAAQARASVVGVLDLLAAEHQAAGQGAPAAAVRGVTDRAVRGVTTTALSPFSYVAAGDLVLFMGITVLVMAVGLVESRRLGLLRRILAAPVRPPWVVAGQVGSLVVAAAGQAAGLLILGRLVFGVHWGDPLAVGLVLVFLALAYAGAATLLGCWARSGEQAVALAVVLGVAGGMLGGCMWTLDAVGPAMRTAGHLVPQAWAMDALTATVFDGSGLAGVLPDIVALAAFAAVLCTLAAWRLRRAATMAW